MVTTSADDDHDDDDDEVERRCLCERVRNLREFGRVVAAVDGAGAVLAHRGPDLGRARPRNRVQLRGVSGAGGVRGLQRA